MASLNWCVCVSSSVSFIWMLKANSSMLKTKYPDLTVHISETTTGRDSRDSAQEVWNVCKSELLMHFSSCMEQYMFRLWGTWTVLSAKKLKEEVSPNKRKLSVSVPLSAVLSLETGIFGQIQSLWLVYSCTDRRKQGVTTAYQVALLCLVTNSRNHHEESEVF